MLEHVCYTKYLFRESVIRIVLPILVIVLAFFVWQNLHASGSVEIKDGRLSPCSGTPNCVNSDAQKAPHAIEPLPYTSDKSLDKIQKFLLENYKAKVIKKTPRYLHIVVTTRYFRFKDDLQFLVQPAEKIISVKSASRVGYSDFGTNKARIEALRKYLDTSKNI